MFWLQIQLTSKPTVMSTFYRLKSDVRLFQEEAKKNGLVCAIAHSASILSWRFYPPRRRIADNLRAEQRLALEYDALHNVDTASEILLADVGVPQGDRKRGHDFYRGVWPSLFDEAMAAVPLDYHHFTFIDYGSGKGKAVFLAAERPFKSAIGIEYASGLHAIASRNLTTYRSDTQRCADISFQHADALTWTPPNEALLCFFFNPFDAATMRQVIERLVGVYQTSLNEIYILYWNLRAVREFRGGFVHIELKQLVRHRNFLWYRVGIDQP
jgi:hypothetical protein